MSNEDLLGLLQECRMAIARKVIVFDFSKIDGMGSWVPARLFWR
jgi:hypothetical protein